MAFFLVLLEVFLHREELIAGGALVADILKQHRVGVHPLEVALEGRLEKVNRDYCLRLSGLSTTYRVRPFLSGKVKVRFVGQSKHNSMVSVRYWIACNYSMESDLSNLLTGWLVYSMPR